MDAEARRSLLDRISVLFDLPPGFEKAQCWSEYAMRPDRFVQLVEAYEQVGHTDVWIDRSLADLIIDNFCYSWRGPSDSAPAHVLQAMDTFVLRHARRLGVRECLRHLASLEDRPGDEYREARWLRENWTRLTGEPLEALVAFDLIANFENPACTRSNGPPALPGPVANG